MRNFLENNKEMIVWLIGIIFMVGTAWNSIQKIEPVELRVMETANRVSVCETKIESQEKLLCEIRGDIKTLLRRSR